MSRFKDGVRRADRRLGRLYWGAFTLLFGALALACAWMAVTSVTMGEGGDRWAGAGLGAVGALLFGAFAWATARKRNLSEVLDDV